MGENSNHLSVNQWIRSAIRDSQQPTSPIGFLFLKLPPPPCAVLLVLGSMFHASFVVHRKSRKYVSASSVVQSSTGKYVSANFAVQSSTGKCVSASFVIQTCKVVVGQTFLQALRYKVVLGSAFLQAV